MYEPTTQIAGAVVVFDMEGLSMTQAWQFTPQFAKRIVDWLQVRLKNNLLKIKKILYHCEEITKFFKKMK